METARKERQGQEKSEVIEDEEKSIDRIVSFWPKTNDREE